MMRDQYFRTSAPRMDGKVEASLEAVSLNPGQVLNKFPHSSAADSSSASSSPGRSCSRSSSSWRRDHQHAGRLHPDRRAEPARRPQAPRGSASCSSPTTWPSATTSAIGRSSCRRGRVVEMGTTAARSSIALHPYTRNAPRVRSRISIGHGATSRTDLGMMRRRRSGTVASTTPGRARRNGQSVLVAWRGGTGSRGGRGRALRGLRPTRRTGTG